MQDTAKRYLAAGLAVLPAKRLEKRPALQSVKKYWKRLPTMPEVEAWFANSPDAMCLLTGAVSGNLELIDFDVQAALWEPWKMKVDAAAPGLLARLFAEDSQSGGRHAAYRCVAAVCGNLHLAQRKRVLGPADVVTVGEAGKQFCEVGGKARLVHVDGNGEQFVVLTLIETRGEGGLFLCTPTAGYVQVQGDLGALPVLTEDERNTLLQAAWELNEFVRVEEARPEPKRPRGERAKPEGERPGDDFNARGDVAGLLAAHGWTLVRGGENSYWRRPGKTSSWSATLKNGVFYVFSSSAYPFEADRAYAPFSVFALLNAGGDFERAAGMLRTMGFGGEEGGRSGRGGRGGQNTENGQVDISGIVGQAGGAAVGGGAEAGAIAAGAGGDATGATGGVVVADDEERPARTLPPDPGPVPERLLRVPGFVNDLMDYSIMTAPYPNPIIAFGAAVALQAFLAGRKVRDPGDNRTNIYLLGLAHSAAGKDHPRKVNTRILHQVGLGECVGDRFASGEGLQDALLVSPSLLFQTDEIDGMLQSINKAKDARHEAAMSTMLTLHSSSNSVYPIRRKAGQKKQDIVDQPSLVIFGTAIPNHYYEALSERMLTNGFFARMIILESGARGSGTEPELSDLPPAVLATAKWWADFQPGKGNLQAFHPEPIVVAYSDQAREAMIGTRLLAEREYDAAEAVSDMVGTTVWGRVSEHARKLALIYACSENHREPRISLAGVEWASQFVMHQTRRMLFMAATHVADTAFEGECMRAMEKLRQARGQQMMHSALLKNMHSSSKLFAEIIDTLTQRGDVLAVDVTTKGRVGRAYLLVE